MNRYLGLVADVGGTNIRLALVASASGKLEQLRTYQCADYPEIVDVIKQYELDVSFQAKHAVIAIACPTEQDWIEMTNHSWKFSKQALQQQLGLERLDVINDYTAISQALPELDESQLVKLGGGSVQAFAPKAVLGPGTGLGVAHLGYAEGRWLSFPGEGGHVDFAPSNELEIDLLKMFIEKYGHVSYERFLCGQGLVDIYTALCLLEEVEPQELAPKEVTQGAVDGSCEYCQRAFELFCKILGGHAGNLALNFAATGGVYVAGGILPRFVELLQNSGFRKRFEAKGRFVDYVKAIPTFLITEPQPGLVGAAAYLKARV